MRPLACLLLLLPALSLPTAGPTPARAGKAAPPVVRGDDAPEIEGPEDVTLRPGRMKVVEVKANGPVVWIPPESDEIDVLPWKEGQVVVSSMTPGCYHLTAVTAKGGKIAWLRVKVCVEGQPPKPPVPPPGPTPPPPGPTPPAPTDPLAQEIQNAFGLDATPAKAEVAKKLAAVYRQGADKVEGVKTAGQLLSELRAVTKGMGIADDALGLVRSRISVELKKVLPGTSSAELTPDTKAAVRSLFVRLAAALDACK